MELVSRKRPHAKCIVLNCRDYESGRKRLPHPKNKRSLYEEWIKAAGRADLLQLNPEEVFNKKRICTRHFSESSYFPQSKKLKCKAVPDLFLPDVTDEMPLINVHHEESGTSCYNLDAERASKEECVIGTDELDIEAVSLHNISYESIDDWNSRLTTFNEKVGCHDDYLYPVINRMIITPRNVSASNNMQAKESKSAQNDEWSLLEILQSPGGTPHSEKQNGTPNHNIKAKESKSAQNDEWSLLEILQSPGGTQHSEEENGTPNHNMKEVLSVKPKEFSSRLQTLTRPQQVHRTYSKKKDVTAVEQVTLPPNEQLEEIPAPLSTPPRLLEYEDTSVVEPVEIPPNEPLKETTTLLSTSPRLLKAHKTHSIKVLGNKDIDDPTVIKSLLGKVKLKKKGTVYIVPLKGKLENKDITASKLKKIIKDNTTGMNRKQLMKVVHRLKKTGEIPINRRKPRLNYKRPRIKKCTCRIHCLKRGRLAPTVVTSGIATRLEGNALMSDEEVLDPSSYQNLFNVSTILTNVCDKSQIEQLCQLVIESVFRLKNENKNRSMGTLTVYLGQNLAEVQNDFTSENDVEPRNQANSSSINHAFDVFPFCEKENTETLITTENISHNAIPNYSSRDKKTVNVNLQTLHDHNYLALESKILFQKPEYLVNLINVSTYTSSRKKSRILNFTPKQSEKLIAECNKLKKQNERLREMLKKNTLKIKSLNIEMKRLKNLLTKEQRAQLMKDRKASSDIDNIAVAVNSILEMDNSIQNSTTVRKKRSRKKKNVEVGITSNLLSEINHENSTPAKKKNKSVSNNYFEVGEYSLQIAHNPKPVKRKKNNATKNKTKDILTNFEISPALDNDQLTSEISDVLEDNDEFSMYRELYESMIISETI